VPEEKIYPQAKEVHLNTTQNDTQVRKTNPSGQLLHLCNFLLHKPIQKRYMTNVWINAHTSHYKMVHKNSTRFRVTKHNEKG